MPLVRLPARYTSPQSTNAYSRADVLIDREHKFVLISSSPLPIDGVELPVVPPLELVVTDRDDVEAVDEEIGESNEEDVEVRMVLVEIVVVVSEKNQSK